MCCLHRVSAACPACAGVSPACAACPGISATLRACAIPCLCYSLPVLPMLFPACAAHSACTTLGCVNTCAIPACTARAIPFLHCLLCLRCPGVSPACSSLLSADATRGCCREHSPPAAPPLPVPASCTACDACTAVPSPACTISPGAAACAERRSPLNVLFAACAIPACTACALLPYPCLQRVSVHGCVHYGESTGGGWGCTKQLWGQGRGMGAAADHRCACARRVHACTYAAVCACTRLCTCVFVHAGVHVSACM